MKSVKKNLTKKRSRMLIAKKTLRKNYMGGATKKFNVIEIYLSDLELYNIGQNKTFKPSSTQQLNTISKWYYNYLKQTLDIEYDELKYIKVTKDKKLRIVIHTKSFFNELEDFYGEWYNIVKLGNTDYPFYLDNKHKLVLKSSIKKEINEDNLYDLYSPNASMNFYTNMVITRP